MCAFLIQYVATNTRRWIRAPNLQAKFLPTTIPIDGHTCAKQRLRWRFHMNHWRSHCVGVEYGECGELKAKWNFCGLFVCSYASVFVFVSSKYQLPSHRYCRCWQRYQHIWPPLLNIRGPAATVKLQNLYDSWPVNNAIQPELSQKWCEQKKTLQNIL